MNKVNKWWIISDNDVQIIRKALLAHGAIDALHVLSSGLHKTFDIPTDFSEMSTEYVKLSDESIPGPIPPA